MRSETPDVLLDSGLLPPNGLAANSQTLQNSFLTSAFTPATFSSDNVKGLVAAMEYYLRDINQKEPAILQLYDKVIPEIDQALSISNTR